MGILQRLICNHNYVFVRNFTATNGSLRSDWRCKHCGKEMSKDGHHEVYETVKRKHIESFNSYHTNELVRTDEVESVLIKPIWVGSYSSIQNNECHNNSHHDYTSSSSDSCSSSNSSITD